jgi:hypothetical protein
MGKCKNHAVGVKAVYQEVAKAAKELVGSFGNPKIKAI